MNASLARDIWVYDPETGVFTWRNAHGKNILAGTVAGSTSVHGYRHLCYKKRKFRASRIAWLYVHGNLDPAIEIDHRDRCKANDRIANLRPATRKQNLENTGPRRTGFFRGVYWFARTNKWVVKFHHYGEQKNLGYFDCLIDAVARRIRAEREFYTHSTFSKEYENRHR